MGLQSFGSNQYRRACSLLVLGNILTRTVCIIISPRWWLLAEEASDFGRELGFMECYILVGLRVVEEQVDPSGASSGSENAAAVPSNKMMGKSPKNVATIMSAVVGEPQLEAE